MSVLYLALPIALLLAASAIVAFIWSVKQGQYDDLNTPAVRILFDDDPIPPKEKQTSSDPLKEDSKDSPK